MGNGGWDAQTGEAGGRGWGVGGVGTWTVGYSGIAPGPAPYVARVPQLGVVTGQDGGGWVSAAGSLQGSRGRAGSAFLTGAYNSPLLGQNGET